MPTLGLRQKKSGTGVETLREQHGRELQGLKRQAADERAQLTEQVAALGEQARAAAAESARVRAEVSSPPKTKTCRSSSVRRDGHIYAVRLTESVDSSKAVDAHYLWSWYAW